MPRIENLTRCPNDPDDEEFSAWYGCDECFYHRFGDWCDHPEASEYELDD